MAVVLYFFRSNRSVKGVTSTYPTHPDSVCLCAHTSPSPSIHFGPRPHTTLSVDPDPIWVMSLEMGGRGVGSKPKLCGPIWPRTHLSK